MKWVWVQFRAQQEASGSHGSLVNNVLAKKKKLSALDSRGFYLANLSPKATVLANYTYASMVQKLWESLSHNYRGIIHSQKLWEKYGFLRRSEVPRGQSVGETLSFFPFYIMLYRNKASNFVSKTFVIDFMQAAFENRGRTSPILFRDNLSSISIGSYVQSRNIIATIRWIPLIMGGQNCGRSRFKL